MDIYTMWVLMAFVFIVGIASFICDWKDKIAAKKRALKK